MEKTGIFILVASMLFALSCCKDEPPPMDTDSDLTDIPYNPGSR